MMKCADPEARHADIALRTKKNKLKTLLRFERMKTREQLDANRCDDPMESITSRVVHNTRGKPIGVALRVSGEPVIFSGLDVGSHEFFTANLANHGPGRHSSISRWSALRYCISMREYARRVLP